MDQKSIFPNITTKICMKNKLGFNSNWIECFGMSVEFMFFKFLLMKNV